MLAENQIGRNPSQVGIQSEGRSKMRTKQSQIEASAENQSRAGTPSQEIAQIQATEYRRHRLGDREVILLSPDTLRRMANGGFSPLAYDSQLGLKKDIALALEKFSPAERRIIFRVLVQGQSIDLATKGSRFSTSHWKHRFATEILPSLRESLKDYRENEKVVLS